MPTPTFMGLRLVLKKIMNEGLQQRFERHRKSAKAVRAALRTMGLELFVRDEIASNTLTSVRVPPGIRLGDIIATMENEHNTMIAGGVGPTQGKIIRIAHMGATASPNYILPALSALEKTLKKLGYPITLDSGVKAAKTILES
jgi:aspartate aminotransferase-like enzyme